LEVLLYVSGSLQVLPSEGASRTEVGLGCYLGLHLLLVYPISHLYNPMIQFHQLKQFISTETSHPRGLPRECIVTWLTILFSLIN
jgi:hypothetical protein